VLVKWNALAHGCSLAGGHGHSEDCVRAEFAFVWRAIQLDHLSIKPRLFSHIKALQLFRNDRVDVLHCLEAPLGHITLLIAVAQLTRFVDTS